jgi:ABC-2 type transport system permease protein
MLKILILKEFKNILLSPKFVATFVIVSALVMLSVFIGIKEYKIAEEQYETGLQLAQQQIRETRNWAGAETVVFRKPNPMQVFVSGVNNDIGRLSEIGPHVLTKLRNSMYSDDPVFAIFRSIDFVFIIQIILSLLAILFTFDAINGEKESGTLKMVLCNSISRKHFIVAKFIGSWLGLMVPLTVPLLLSILIVLAMGIPMEGHWSKLLLLIIMSLHYFTFFICFGILVSALTKRSVTSFLILLVFWVVAVLIVPRIGILAAGQIIETRGQAELESQVEQFENELWSKHEQYLVKANRERNMLTEGMSQEDRTAYREEHMWQWMEEDEDNRSKMQQEIVEYRRRAWEEMINKKQLQENLGLNLARISPASLYMIAAMNIADTDINIKSRTEKKIDDYANAFAAFTRKKQEEDGGQGGGIQVTMDSDVGMSVKVADMKKTVDVSEMPQFVDEPRPLSDVLAQILMDSGILSLMIAMTFIAAFIAFMRFDVR